MNAHRLTARCLDGTLLEIGTIGSAEAAARLHRSFVCELGEEYLSFAIEVDELEEPPAATSLRGLRYDELRPPSRDARRDSRWLQ